MLLFFQDGSEMQIVIGAVISIVSLILFGAIQPFLDDKADKLATFAQVHLCEISLRLITA